MTNDEFRKAVAPKVLANKYFNKIFCVGYNKTGTTTLETVLRLYGYKLPSQTEQEIRLTKNVFETNYTEFIDFIRQYDAFQDLPFSQGLTFVAADALFPNSKFILSVRDPEIWFRSLTNFHKKTFGTDLEQLSERGVREINYLYHGYIYANKTRLLTTFKDNEQLIDWTKLYDEEYYIEQYKQRNEAIKKYFSNAPGKLLVIDVTKEATTERLLDFLNIPKDLITLMPHDNKT